MRRAKTLKWIIKFSLFVLTLTVGTMAALNAGETAGLARVDLTNAPVESITQAPDGRTLYAEVTGNELSGTLYRSADNGRSWEIAGAVPSEGIKTLTVASDNSAVLYAGGVGGPMENVHSLWRSEDGGQNWQQFGLNLPANAEHQVPDVTALAIDPHQPEFLYVGTDGQGVYRFDRTYPGYELVGGTTLYNAHVKKLLVSDDSRLYALTAGGLFVTADDGWQKIETPETFITLAVSPYAFQTLYAGSASSGLYRSEDGGQSWEAINDGLTMPAGAAVRITALAVDEQNPMNLVVATAYGLGSQLAPGELYQSRDDGAHWAQVTDLSSLVSELRLHNGLIQATTEHGLVRYGRVTETAYGVVETAPVTNLEALQSLVRPTPNQIAILAITLGLAGLILLNPLHWFEREREDSFG